MAIWAQHGKIVREYLSTTLYPDLHGVHVDFQVRDALPNVSFPLGRNWAGNIPVGRPNQPNDTLFFWGFEKENGSFTANSTEPWGIWLNGGYVHRSLSRFSNLGLRIIAPVPARQVWLGSFSR